MKYNKNSQGKSLLFIELVDQVLSINTKHFSISTIQIK